MGTMSREEDALANQKPVKIIMIEDDEGHARLIERNIRRAGVNNEVEHFTSGTEALAKLLDSDTIHGGQAYLVLLDLNLPDMSGVDILRQLKETERTRSIPVIVLTTTDDSREIQRCYDLGCSVYITKPVNYESLSNAIRQLGLFLLVVQLPEGA